MATAKSNLLLRQMPTGISKCLRSFSTVAEVRHRQPPQNHKFLDPNNYIGSWEAPKDPKEAQAKLALLRRQYAKQVKEVRKEYIREVELMRLEKQRKEEAKREAIRVAREERNKLKAAEAKVRAEERKVAEQEFRQTLVRTLNFLIIALLLSHSSFELVRKMLKLVRKYHSCVC